MVRVWLWGVCSEMIEWGRFRREERCEGEGGEGVVRGVVRGRCERWGCRGCGQGGKCEGWGRVGVFGKGWVPP